MEGCSISAQVAVLTTASCSLPLTAAPTPKENAGRLPKECLVIWAPLPPGLSVALCRGRRGSSRLVLGGPGLGREGGVWGPLSLGAVFRAKSNPWGIHKRRSARTKCPQSVHLPPPQAGQGLSCPVERAFLAKPGCLLGHQGPEGSRLSQACGQCWPWPGPPTPSCGGLSAKEEAL